MTNLHCVHGEQEKQLTLMDPLPQRETTLTAHTFAHDKPVIYLHFIEDELGKLPCFKEQVFDITKREI